MSVRLEARGAARVLTIDRPSVRNALDTETLRALSKHALLLREDESARGIVLTGAGAFFVSGADLREFGPKTSRGDAKELARLGRETLRSLRSARLPLVAAINGDAFGGGCELAVSCDRRIVEAQARMHWVHARMEVTTAWGGTARLVSLVGAGLATKWILSAATVSAEDALRAGLADEIAPTGEAVERACAWINSFTAFDRGTTRAQLTLLRRASKIDSVLVRAELRTFQRRWSSEAHRDAVQRFQERPREKS